ncbi:MAG: cell surface protein SprA [Candidatus Eisenbacteria bacterium]|nr:cell surface protein SprA [Candidatus Eisenbacteria bacterium]
MLTSLPALIVLIGLPHFGFRGAHPPAPADTLPPAWKAASRLALEDQFVKGGLRPLVRGPVALRLNPDPRALRVTVDPDSGTVVSVTQLGELPLGPGVRRPFGAYAHELGQTTFQRLWLERTKQNINSRAGTSSAPRPGISFALPSPLPRRVQSLLGPGGPALSVSGSENIKLAGQSDWSNQQVGVLGQRRSLFPTLNMQQDLDIRLEGQLSDRIRVNLLQNSANQIPLANRIAINYRGDEDDLIQALDLGNTSLTLPGTQYVSYSGKNEGLFGIKTAARYGPLDFTVLASKQEGKSERASYGGGASKQSYTLNDFDYARGVYFLLYDPNRPSLDIDQASIRVYFDDFNALNSANKAKGIALVDPTAAQTDTVVGNFVQLSAGADKDYEILRDVYGPYFKVLRIKRALTGDQRLAVAYNARLAGSSGPYDIQVGGETATLPDGASAIRMKLIRAPYSVLEPDSTGGVNALFDTLVTRAPFNGTRELELRNFYQLPGQRIDPASLKITVRRGNDVPAKISKDVVSTPVPYLEAVGLDNFDESSGTPVRGHDGRVDGTLANSQTRLFVDYENGVLFFYDLRPFAPRLGSGHPFEDSLNVRLLRRFALTGPPDGDDGANRLIYDKYIPQRALDSRYYIDVDFTAAQAAGEITLGRGNVLEGSEVVTVNGQAWVRDRDYTIDYDLGRVTLKRQLGPSDNLNVDYSYAPLFQQAGRTLVGSAFRLEGREKSLGGAFMYESKGAQDLRPRLGEEPSRSLISDLNTEWTFHPDWVTRLVDRLPGVRTTAPSDFHVQAEVGMSFPNPNTRNEVYIDDMEGVRDAASLSMGSERWRSSSVPRMKTPTGLEVPVRDSLSNAELRWYSPFNAVKERDLKPNLSDAQGGRNSRQVLGLSVPRRPHSGPADPTVPLWAGLMYPLDPQGLDLSRSQFIEIWVNDFNDQHDPSDGLHRVRGGPAHPGIRLRIDLGTVSEDQMRAPDEPPDDSLDTEDRVRDGQLTVTEGNDEDTGYDGLLDAKGEQGAHAPRDLVTASSADPEGDDFHTPDERVSRDEKLALDPRSWVSVNGTEGNKSVNPTPDTEDLNLNNVLDTNNSYVEYTIDLGDTASRYLVTDVQREFAAAYPAIVGPDNGWRRYRIPINDSLSVRFGNPNLALVRHLRVWLQGIVEPDSSLATYRKPLLMLGSLDIVGSRWQQADLDSISLMPPATTLTLNSVNSVDNADVYVAPFDPGQTRTGSQELTRREQSLSLEFTDLKPGATLEAFKTFSIDENYSRYGKLDWYAAAFDVRDFSAPQDTALYYFVRFASDELERNYYEVRSRITVSSQPRQIAWQKVDIGLTDLSNIKLRPGYVAADTEYSVPGAAPGDLYIVKGRPSFTRLRRISFGLLNRTGRTFHAGQLWFNELRATDVARDVDHAQRVFVNGRLANLMGYNLSWNGRGADFLSVGESRGTGNSLDQLSFGSNVDLHRFFEGTGVVLPLNLNYTRSSSRPRFTAGDDVVRSGSLAAASETRTETRSFGTSYARNWSERSNPFLRYTVGGITAGYNRSETKGRNPNSVDSSVTTGASVNYGISPRRLLAIGLPRARAKLYPLPERFYWNYSVGTSRTRTFERVGPLRDTLRLRNDVSGRSAFIDFGADTRPLDFVHHHFEARRNLMLSPQNVRNERIGFVNFGRVTSWRQSMDSRYSLSRGNWVRPSFNWNSTYMQNNGPELSKDLSTRSVSNGQSVSMNWDLPFDRLATGSGPPPRPGSPADTAHARRRGSALPWRSWLARIGSLSTDASLNKASSYTRLAGTPSLLYLLGLSSDPDSSRTTRLFGNDASDGLDWRFGARTRVDLGLGAFLNTRYDFSTRQTTTNGVRNRSSTTRFPDLDVEYGRVAGAIRLDRLLRNPRLRTAYSRSTGNEFVNNSSSRSGASASSEWRPLVGLNGDFKNGARAELRIEKRNTERENFQLGHSLAVDRNTTVNFSVSRSYSRGQKVNLLGKSKTVSSTVTVGLTGQFEKRSGGTVTYQDRSRSHPGNTLYPVREDRLSLNGTGSYGFSTNVTGNLSLGYGQSNDRQRSIKRRNVRVELRAQFTF